MKNQKFTIFGSYASMHTLHYALKSLRDEELKSSSLRASKGCVAISFATGLLRHFVPRNDDFTHSAHNSLVTSNSLLVTRKQAKLAFTMAEILLSLTIIGVVAAITLPSLTGNINERTWNTQRKALYARFSQAIALMPALNGYGTLDDTTDNATETFLTAGLSKVLKINNICSNNFGDCGVVSSFRTMANSSMNMPSTLYGLNDWFRSVSYQGYSYSTPDTKAVAFETQNGENIVAYYNRNCRTEYLSEATKSNVGNYFGFPELTMCLNFIYDLNGKKGPNTVGKDIGIITIFNATDSTTVAPMPNSTINAANGVTVLNATSACKTQDPESRIPNIDELSSMLINKDIFDLAETAPYNCYWSSSRAVRENFAYYWRVCKSNGVRVSGANGSSDLGSARCIKR